jgi:RNA polymerase subunit RPABC4/transcription elongation factor Spt4
MDISHVGYEVMVMLGDGVGDQVMYCECCDVVMVQDGEKYCWGCSNVIVQYLAMRWDDVVVVMDDQQGEMYLEDVRVGEGLY